MNEQLQNAVTELINTTLEGVDAGAEFLGDQIPEFIIQLLFWLVGTMIGLLHSIVAIGFLIIDIKKRNLSPKANP